MNPYTHYDKADEYLNHNVSDANIEICLKVLRTIRNACLMPGSFDADGAVVLSHAHAKVLELAEKCWDPEEVSPALVTQSMMDDMEEQDKKKMQWLNGPQHITNKQLKYWKEFVACMQVMGNDLDEFTEDQLRGRYEEWRDNGA